MKKTFYSILICTFVSTVLATESAQKSEIKVKVTPSLRVTKWEQTIKDFESLDAKNPSPDGAVLLIGGSNARRWVDIDKYFPKHRMINRGFGGARLTEILHFSDRIILPHTPKIIIINAGGNDIAAGSTPAQISKSAQALITTIHANLPDTQIYFLGLPYVRWASSNPKLKGSIRDMNRLFANLAKSDEKVEFIDLATAFLTDTSKFRPELFVKDGIHFSLKGYELLTGLLREKLNRGEK